MNTNFTEAGDSWGARFRSTPPSGRSVTSLLESSAARRPDRVFYSWRGSDHTIGDVNRRANIMARNLVARGIGAGSRVGVIMATSPEYLSLWFALGKLGAVEVPINTAYKGKMLADQLNRARVETVVCDDAFLANLEDVADEVTPLREIIVRGSSTHLDFGVLEASASDENLDVAVDPAAVVCVMYTSGTTGISKGVMLSNSGLAAFGFLYVDITGLGDTDVVLNYSPFHHVAGKFLTIACLVTDARMVLSEQFSVSTFWRDVRAYGITNFAAIGGVCNMLCSTPAGTGDTDNTVRVVYAVPAPSELYAEFETRFGCKIVEAYGSTEIGLVLSTPLTESIPGSCGRPNEFFDVRVVDEDLNDVPIGTAGEIIVRSDDPLLMLVGYDGLPDKTTEAWRGGWFHTGDRAYKDDEGRFWFQDRLKDSIRRRGENISSYEIERIIGRHPDVAESVAIPSPADVGEDEVRIVVVPRDGANFDPEALFHYCVEHMAYFMVPRYIDVVDELPRTPTSKVEKYKLRQTPVGPSTWDAKAQGWRPTRSGLARVDVPESSPRPSVGLDSESAR